MEINIFATDLIKYFFKELNRLNIQYAVLRNYEGLPEINNSKDVDIVIHPNELKEAILILKKIAKEIKYQLIWENKLDYLEGFVFVKSEYKDISSIKIDLFNGFKWRGYSYINHNLIFSTTVRYNGFRVPTKAHEAFIMILYYILYARMIPSKYTKHIYLNLIQNIKEFQYIVEKTFSIKLSIEIVDFSKNNQFVNLISLRSAIRNHIIYSNLKNKYIFMNVMKHIKTEYLSRNSFGTLIVLSGPDDVGKNTLIEPIMKLFNSLGINKELTPHSLTKNISKKYIHQVKTRGLMNSILQTSYYFIDIKKELRHNNIIIFNNYYTDMMANSIHIKISLTKQLVQKIFKLLPSPYFNFIILAEKEKNLQNKNKLNEKKVIELLLIYENMPNIMSNCKVLYTNDSIDTGQVMLCKNIFNILEKRYK